MRLSVVVPCHNERACLPLLLDALEDAARDFRLMRRPMVDAVLALPERNRFTKGLYGWVGFRTHWIAYENAERAAGGSAWGFWGLVRYAVGGIVDFSSRSPRRRGLRSAPWPFSPSPSWPCARRSSGTRWPAGRRS